MFVCAAVDGLQFKLSDDSGVDNLVKVIRIYVPFVSVLVLCFN